MTVILRFLRLRLRQLRAEQSGATALEYGLLGALIAVATMGAVSRITQYLDLSLVRIMLMLRFGSA